LGRKGGATNSWVTRGSPAAPAAKEVETPPITNANNANTVAGNPFIRTAPQILFLHFFNINFLIKKFLIFPVNGSLSDRRKLWFLIQDELAKEGIGLARIKSEDSIYKTNSVVEKTERLQESVKC
jgi:hypothetical protein